MRRRIVRRRILAVALAGLLVSSSLAGCALVMPEHDQREATTVDYGDVADAAKAAVPRIVSVDEPSRSMNGFGYRLSIGFETDSADPFTADELDALVEAIWTTLPWEPNTISIVAGAAVGDEVVDLRAAAEELGPLGVTNAGRSGVSLTSMSERYGDWTAPE